MALLFVLLGRLLGIRELRDLPGAGRQARPGPAARRPEPPAGTSVAVRPFPSSRISDRVSVAVDSPVPTGS